jgi:intracellular multiplication protein IcmL
MRGNAAEEKAMQKASPKTTSTIRIRAATGIEAYRDGFYMLFGVVKLLAIVIFGLTAFNLYLAYTHHPLDRYYAESMEGSKRPLTALRYPNMNKEALLNWAASAATEVMTFGFSDYDARLYNTRFLFTPEGWVKFAPAVMSSDLLKSVQQSQQILTAVPRTQPVILWEGVVRGQYKWIVHVPLLLSIRAGELKTTKHIVAELHIVRVPTSEMPNGIGIQLWRSY